MDRPDPATIIVPDMVFSPSRSDIRRFDEYFYFHKPAVSYERAFADLDQCRMFGLAAKILPVPPPVVPLGGEVVKFRVFKEGMEPGIILALILGGVESDQGQADSRKCMWFKGYLRYGLSRAIFKKIDQGGDAEKLGRLALIAAGAAPQAGAIEP